MRSGVWPYPFASRGHGAAQNSRCTIEIYIKHTMCTMTRRIFVTAFYRTRWSYSPEGSGTPLPPKSLLLECLIPGVSRSNVSFKVNGELTVLDAREGLLWVKTGSRWRPRECRLSGAKRKLISGDWRSVHSQTRTFSAYSKGFIFRARD